MTAAPKGRQGGEAESPLPQEGVQLCLHFDFGPVKMILASDLLTVREYMCVLEGTKFVVSCFGSFCACVCVCERDRQTQRERRRKRER